MNTDRPPLLRCAIYTRKSSEEGLEQAFNSLDAQREACEAYIKSQASEGWHPIRTRYDDGGLSGGSMDRPALRQLLADIAACKVNTVVVYKVDRLTRSLADFAKIVEVFDTHGVSFVSVTQQFNTTTSMGRLTLNMLLSFAQFEREVTGERIRDKIAASKKKGMWMGGFVPLGYQAQGRTLAIDEPEAETVRTLFRLYLEHGNVRRVKAEADRLGLRTKIRPTASGEPRGGRLLSRGHIYKLLNNPLYAGRIAHKGAVYEGLHPAIIEAQAWGDVQAKLAGNTRDRRSGVSAAEPSLLAGLLHDSHANRFSPSHTVKKGVRYRYYVSQAVLQHQDAGPVTRIPAREIEELVCARIGSFLVDTGKLIDEIGMALGPRDQQRLIAGAKVLVGALQQFDTAEQRAVLLRTVAGVTVTEVEVAIALRRGALRAALLAGASSRHVATLGSDPLNAPTNDDELIIQVPARLKLSAGEMRLVIPPAQARELPPHPSTALVKAVTRTQAWRRRLLSDPAFSLRAIARENGLSDRYVSRLMPLAFLAPDIVEAILDGHQPADLDLEQLLQGIPLSWSEQRRRFGFAVGG